MPVGAAKGGEEQMMMMCEVCVCAGCNERDQGRPMHLQRTLAVGPSSPDRSAKG